MKTTIAALTIVSWVGKTRDLNADAVATGEGRWLTAAWSW